MREFSKGYVKVWSGIWGDRKFRSLSDRARFAYLRLLTGPNLNRRGVGQISIDRFNREALFELYKAGIIDWDGEQRISIREWFNSSRVVGADDADPPRKWIPSWLRKSVFERDGHRCVYCGAESALQLDHRLPYVRGGKDEADNLVTACKPCNTSKGPRTVEEWAS